MFELSQKQTAPTFRLALKHFKGVLGKLLSTIIFKDFHDNFLKGGYDNFFLS
jgi:hypothetical protein